MKVHKEEAIISEIENSLNSIDQSINTQENLISGIEKYSTRLTTFVDLPDFEEKIRYPLKYQINAIISDHKNEINKKSIKNQKKFK